MAGREGRGTRSPDPRRLIADAARRLVAGAASDPASALASAARAAGWREAARLPPLDAVVEAAKAERALFGGAEHRRRLTALRREALEAMRFLAAFEPRLVGGVLDGWAGAETSIELQVYCDEPDAVVQRLGELGVHPQVLRARGADPQPLERLGFVAGGRAFVVSVYRAADLRQRTTARGLGRADLAAVEALVAGG